MGVYMCIGQLLPILWLCLYTLKQFNPLHFQRRQRVEILTISFQAFSTGDTDARNTSEIGKTVKMSTACLKRNVMLEPVWCRNNMGIRTMAAETKGRRKWIVTNRVKVALSTARVNLHKKTNRKETSLPEPGVRINRSG